MELIIHRTIEPYGVTASLQFGNEELIDAFDVQDPNEDLFFDLFGPDLETKSTSLRLAILAAVASLVEGEGKDNAATLGLVASPPEQK